MLEYVQIAFNFGVATFNQVTRIFTAHPIITTSIFTLVFISLVMTYIVFPVLRHGLNSASDSAKDSARHLLFGYGRDKSRKGK